MDYSFRNILSGTHFMNSGFIISETKNMCSGNDISKWFFAFQISYFENIFYLQNPYSGIHFAYKTLISELSKIIKDNSGIA